MTGYAPKCGASGTPGEKFPKPWSAVPEVIFSRTSSRSARPPSPVVSTGFELATLDHNQVVCHRIRRENLAKIHSQRDEFRELVDALDRALVNFSDQLEDLEGVLGTATDEAVNVALNSVLEQGPAETGQLAEVFEQEITEVGPRGASILACQFLREETGQEREILGAKFERLASGEVPNANLRPLFRCALYLAKLGAAAAAVIGTHGLALALSIFQGVEMGSGGWKKSRCKETWAELTRDRL